VHRRGWIAPVIAAAVVIGGCSSSSSSSSSSGSGTSSGQTRTIKVDNSTPAFHGAFLAYFPNEVSVHAGDTVDFSEVFTGEPHSVTLGTLVEKGLTAAKAADPNGPPPADFASLPQMLPNGPGDADQRAVNPCFVDTGALPTAATSACPKVSQPAFNGNQAYYSSGFLSKGSDFKVQLASDIKPGAYHYYCNLHGPQMSGTITVVPSSTTVPTQTDVDTLAASQLATLVSGLTPAFAAASAGHAQLPPGINMPIAGLLSQTVQNAQIEQFFPAVIHAKVGQKVSWAILGPHTITFGAADPPPFVLQQAPDGAWHASQSVGAPVPPPTGPPPNPNATAPYTVSGGAYSGTGLHSSGVQASFPPAIVTYTLSFAKAGTYNYVCLIHPGMTGQVIVS
jgi:plastocyanin